MTYYPVTLSIRGTRVLVVGAGKVAGRKVASLLRSRARVTVIAPEATPALQRLAKQGKLSWFNRKVKKSDIAKAQVVIAATKDTLINKKISLWSAKRGVLVNIVDNPALSSFISPAVFRSSKAVIAVNTNGRDPEFSRDLKNFLKEHWDEFLSYRRRLQKRAS